VERPVVVVTALGHILFKSFLCVTLVGVNLAALTVYEKASDEPPSFQAFRLTLTVLLAWSVVGEHIRRKLGSRRTP
jgi:hypothetical protein